MNDPNQPYPPQQPYPQQPYPQQPYPQQHPYPPQQPYAQQPYAQQPYVQQQPYPQPPYVHGFAPQQAWLRPQYEFTKEENETLADLATWCGGLAILKFVAAVLSLLGRNMVGAAIEMAVGLSLWGGRTSLRAVVDTQGNDVTHLMNAVDKLATVFQIRLVLTLIGAIGVAILVTILVALALTNPQALEEILAAS